MPSCLQPRRVCSRPLTPTADLALTEAESEQILALSDVVTLARTAVEHDYRGDVIDAHAPEMPTRFAKQLTQLFRGGLALGMNRGRLADIVTRCARDSTPPLRLAALLDVAEHPEARTSDVRRRMDKPRATVDRTLQALHMLGMLTVEEEENPATERVVWRYSLSPDLDRDALDALAGKSARNVERYPKAIEPSYSHVGHVNISGTSHPGPVNISGTSSRCPSCGAQTEADADLCSDCVAAEVAYLEGLAS